MGKHSSPESTPFVRSIAAWALPWFLIACVIAVALIVALRMTQDDPVTTSASGGPEVGASAQPSEPAEDEEEKEPAEEKPEEKKETKPKDKERDPTEEPSSDPELITKGIDLQVLNGTGDAAADDLVADKLARLGYSVVAVSPAAKAYQQTVVFYVGDSEEVGRRLAERFDWGLEPAPSNLSQEVRLHVVVGENSL